MNQFHFLQVIDKKQNSLLNLLKKLKKKTSIFLVFFIINFEQVKVIAQFTVSLMLNFKIFFRQEL